MPRIRIKFTPFAAVTVVALALLATLWANGSSPSEAQQGAMHSCPQAGQWAIAVWDGDDGTDAEQAFATCGADAVAAAYSIDPQTQGWSRWFYGQPGLSTVSTLDNMQGVIALGAVGGPPPTATSTPSGRIAFECERDGNVEICAMNADGTGLTNLTNNAAGDWVPAWCPNGTRIAFQSDRDGNDEIYVMNADGSGLTRLTDNPAADGAPTWSPDGTRISFSSDRDGNDDIYVMSADGSGLTRLTDNSAPDIDPSWSPDGTRIAFASGWAPQSEIYVMNADGSGLTRLTDDQAGGRSPAWSPDGSSIAFESAPAGNPEIYVMNADGSGLTRLTHDAAGDHDPTWSPDSTRIAFEAFRDGTAGEIYVMNADGSGQTNLTNNPALDRAPAWSPSTAGEGTMHNCPQPDKWAISVWSGPNMVGADQALATCDAGAVAAAYYLDPQTGGWLRWFRGRPGISSLATLNDLQGIIALGSPEFTLGVDKVGEGTVTSSPGGIDCGTDCTSQSAAFLSDISVVLTASAGPGLTLLHWTGCDSVSDNSCTVKIDADETLLATFGLAEVDVQAVREDAFIDGVPVARSVPDSDLDPVSGLHDGLNDFQEGLLGTDPSKRDTDGDGVVDGYEFFHGSDPNDSSSTPPPGGDTSGHSDDDGLSNFQESLLGTDSNNPDTDGDTFRDGDEFGTGSSPLIPGNVPPPVVPQVLVGQEVLVDIEQVIRLDASTIPAGFGPVSVDVMNHLHPPEGQDCTMSFHVTPQFADLVQGLHFWSLGGDLDLFPVDGVVVAPLGQELSVGFTLDMMPGQSITLDELVGFTCAGTGHRQFGLHKMANPVDPRILDRNEPNNELHIFFGVTVAAP